MKNRLGLSILAFILILMSACAQKSPAATIDAQSTTATPEGQPGTPTSEPTPVEPTPTAGAALDYDVDIYGALESLELRGQEVAFWYWSTTAQNAAIQAQIEDFNAHNPWGITVSGARSNDASALYEKISTAITAKTWPSLAMTHPDHAATYAGNEALIELSPYVASPTWGYSAAELNEFSPHAMETLALPQFEGRYSWPLYRTLDVLLYNQDWLLELGYSEPPETWEAFQEIACATVRNPFSQASGEGAASGVAYAADARTFTNMVASRGGLIVSDTMTSTLFSRQEGLDTLNYLNTLTRNRCAVQLEDPATQLTEFGEGRLLFALANSAQLRAYGQACDTGSGFTWKVAPLPHSTPDPLIGIDGVDLSLFASEPQEQLAAWVFVTWLSQAEQQSWWSSSQGTYPVLQSASALIPEYLASYPRYVQAAEFLTLNYIHATDPALAEYETCRGALTTMLGAVFGGERAQTQLDLAAAACDAALEAGNP